MSGNTKECKEIILYIEGKVKFIFIACYLLYIFSGIVHHVGRPKSSLVSEHIMKAAFCLSFLYFWTFFLGQILYKILWNCKQTMSTYITSWAVHCYLPIHQQELLTLKKVPKYFYIPHLEPPSIIVSLRWDYKSIRLLYKTCLVLFDDWQWFFNPNWTGVREGRQVPGSAQFWSLSQGLN
jgi:hypothetical protein